MWGGTGILSFLRVLDETSCNLHVDVLCEQSLKKGKGWRYVVIPDTRPAQSIGAGVS
jgi:hypothetical protein